MNKIFIPYAFNNNILDNEAVLDDNNLTQEVCLYVLPFKYDISNSQLFENNINYIYTRNVYTNHIKQIFNVIPYNLYLYIPKECDINHNLLLNYYITYLNIYNYIVDTEDQYTYLKNLKLNLNILLSQTIPNITTSSYSKNNVVLTRLSGGQQYMVQKNIFTITTDTNYNEDDYQYFFKPEIVDSNHPIFINYNNIGSTYFLSIPADNKDKTQKIYYLNDLVLSSVPFFFDKYTIIDIDKFYEEYMYYLTIYGAKPILYFSPETIIKFTDKKYTFSQLKTQNLNEDEQRLASILSDGIETTLQKIYKSYDYDTLIIYDSLNYKNSNILQALASEFKEFNNYNMNIICLGSGDKESELKDEFKNINNQVLTHTSINTISKTEDTPIDKGRISIIIPYYKSNDSIRECLYYGLSNLKDKDKFEIIFVCDGSDDEPLMKERFKDLDMDMRFLSLESNQGVSAAKNFGLKAATGKYVCFWDSDDLLLAKNLYKTITSKDADVYYAPRISLANPKETSCFSVTKLEYLHKHNIVFTSLKKEEDTTFLDILDAHTTNIYHDMAVAGIWNYAENDNHITQQGDIRCVDENALCSHLLAIKIILSHSLSEHAMAQCYNIAQSSYDMFVVPRLKDNNYNVKHLFDYCLYHLNSEYQLSQDLKSLQGGPYADKKKAIEVLDDMADSNPIFASTATEMKDWYNLNG